MAEQPEPEGFKFSPDDPLADERAAVAAWIEDPVATLGRWEYGDPVDLKSLPSRRRLLEGKPEQSPRYSIVRQIDVR